MTPAFRQRPWRSWTIVIIGSLLAGVFLWMTGNRREWVAYLETGDFARRAMHNLLANIVGLPLAGVALWRAAAWARVQFGLATAGEDTLALVSRKFYWLWGFAPALVLGLLPRFLVGPAEPIQILLLAAFLGALARLSIPPPGADTLASTETSRPPLYKRLWFWALAVTLLVALDRTLAGCWRHWAMRSNMDDLGMYHQALWGLIHGKGYWTTIYIYENFSILSEHLFLSLALLAPVAWLWSDAVMLYVAQTFFILLGALCLYHIARIRTQTPWFPLLAVLLFIIHPALERGWVTDFHIDAMEVGFFLAAWLGLLQRRPWLYWPALIALMGCKEDVGLTVAAVGFWFFVFEKRRAAGSAIAVTGFAWSFVGIVFVLPALAGVAENPQIANYAHLGHGIHGIVWTLVTRPYVFLLHLLTFERIAALLLLFAPLAFINLARPSTVLLVIPFTITTILSGWHPQMTLQNHYGLVFVGPVFAGFVEGWRALEQRWRRTPSPNSARLGWTITLILCALAMHHQAADLPLTKPLRWRVEYPITARRDAVMDRILATIPDDASVAAQNYIGTQLAWRQWLYKFPMVYEEAEYILLDAEDLPRPEYREYYQAVEAIIASGLYGLEGEEQGVYLLRRSSQPQDDLAQRLAPVLAPVRD